MSVSVPPLQDGRAYPLGPEAIVSDLEKEGRLQYGTKIETEFFEARLLKGREDGFFSLEISKVSDLLIERGFSLNGYGGRRRFYHLVDNSRNAAASRAMLRRARKEAYQASTLTLKTARTGLTDAQIAELDQLHRRATNIQIAIEKPKMLEKLVKQFQPKRLGR